MSCHGNNATAPGPALAPGAGAIDPARAAVEAAARGMHPGVRAVVPGFDAPFFQAGLAGYSDAAMRIIARRHGCPLCVTEALLDRTLLAGGHGFDKADLALIRDNIPAGEEDLPLAGQIIGSDPGEMAAAALKMIEQAARGDRWYRAAAAALSASAASPVGSSAGASLLVDVNLACPVKKIQSKSRGGHWLSEPGGAIDILRAVREAVPRGVACTVKLRRAFDDSAGEARKFERIFEAAYELGYAWATVHARTVAQKYVGPSDWGVLRDLVRRYPDRVIFGSGDVWSAADIFRMIAYTGVAAVSVARGCIGNPWVFRQAREMMCGERAAPPTLAQQRAVLEDHFEIAARLHGPRRAPRLMRKFGIRFAAHHPEREKVRAAVIGVETGEEWGRVVGEFYPRVAGEGVAGAGGAGLGCSVSAGVLKDRCGEGDLAAVNGYPVEDSDPNFFRYSPNGASHQEGATWTAQGC